MKVLTIDNHNLKAGDVINVEYVGDNAAYRKKNGKRTYRITKVDKKTGKIEYRELFYAYGYPLDPEMPSNTIYHSLPGLLCNADDVVTRIKDPRKEGHIHGLTVSLAEAYRRGWVKLSTIQSIFKDQSGSFIRTNPIVHWTGKSNQLRRWWTVSVDDKLVDPEYPVLTGLAFVYNTTEELYDDIERVTGWKPYRFD
jgi:hypothetical protein